MQKCSYYDSSDIGKLLGMQAVFCISNFFYIWDFQFWRDSEP